MTTLIDVTDRKFLVAANQAVLAYIAKANPFAHTDVGSKLIALSKALPDIVFYCPDFRNCAYVALHDKSNRIIALAASMRDLHFRLPLRDIQPALSAGAERSEIGSEWIFADAFAAKNDWDATLQSWCASASQSFE
jgi:hypothetical protein